MAGDRLSALAERRERASRICVEAQNQGTNEYPKGIGDQLHSRTVIATRSKSLIGFAAIRGLVAL